MPLFLNISLGLVVLAITIFGSILTSTKTIHRWLFGIFGAVAVILIVAQGIVSEQQQSVKDKEIGGLKEQVSGLKGSIDILAMVIVRPKEDGAKSSYKKTSVPVTVSKSIQDLSNPELRERTIKICNAMRDFENNYKIQRDNLLNTRFVHGTKEQELQAWQSMTKGLSQLNNTYQNEFNKRYLGEAVSYRDELIRRLNILPPNDERDVIALQGMLAGPSPINDLAIYLEKFARQLPS